jgi:hypothetical protein
VILRLVELGRQDHRERVLLAIHEAGLERSVGLREPVVRGVYKG